MNRKKKYISCFEKIKSIFDNGESGTASPIASSQQALLPNSQFNGEEATISDKAGKMHGYSRIALHAWLNPQATDALLEPGSKVSGRNNET